MIRKLAADAVLVARMRKHGIVNPILTLKAARAAGLPIALACALLEQETGGGRNVFGHDPTIFVGAGAVTKAKYLAYKKARKLSGNRKMQGVGPMQLTYWSFQDQADAQGGCWRPYPNMLVGFTLAARNIRRYGKHMGIRAYNGSGPAAERYADTVLARENKWNGLLRPSQPYAVVQGCPVPRLLAPALSEVLRASGASLQSCYRGPDAEALLHKLGKHSQRELYEGWIHHRVGFNPANPPGRSTHELRNDGVAYSQWKAGASIPWWAVGIDIDDGHVQAFIREAAKRGFKVAQTYPGSRSEYHHVNFRKPPLRTRVKARLKARKV